ncbi:hypothetical protein [Cognatilysobacter bugurensis]|uniref:EF-hand domain-containing protein n=1 Tax=Cognatilysobacter bugurensis TaxID=543356 RepID=A0A918T155_9GAMM|nr:hypothetical protein [Lysobacter bugurensis]GHA83617.1 hypothetical protein GCM10007067_22170 [Lysobacter bugurensis]
MSIPYPYALSLAIAAALAAPIALAQSGDTTQTRRAGTPVQTTQTDAVLRESMITTNAPVREQLDEATPPPAAQVEEEEEAMRRDPRRALRIKPRPARAPAEAQREAWSELDADGDGRVTRTEAEVNADFKSRFELLDADHDGAVTDSEYRASGRVDATRGRDDAIRHDPTLNKGVGDNSRDPARERTDRDD